MGRKIIQIADSTQLVSIPRKWALKHELKKGDELEVSEEGNRLILSTGKVSERGAVDVAIQQLDRDSIMYFVRSLYKNGYDEIIIRFKQPVCENFRRDKQERVTEVIAQEVGRLNGVEIFSLKEDHCVIKSISEDTIKGFDTMLRRIFLLTSEAISDMIEGYEKGDPSLLETIQQKHDVITKFVVYCQRILNKVGYPDYRKTALMYHILEVIDTVMDLIKYNARELLQQKIKGSKEAVTICKYILKSFNMYHDLYYKFSLDKAYQINKNRYEILKLIDENEKEIPKKEYSILKNMEQVLEYILNLTSSR